MTRGTLEISIPGSAYIALSSPLSVTVGSDRGTYIRLHDWQMPYRRRIRSDSQLSGIPIILLTALSGEEQIHKGLKAGADAYIEKPFSPRLLTAQAINLIEQRDRLKTVYADQPAPTAKKELMKNDTERRFLLQFDAYIENHISDYNLTVDMMAAHFEYGRTRFYIKVRQLTGKTPNDYLKEKRLTKAAELLSESESITISEVAYQVGINNAQYFSVNFKKMFGVTPSAYQKGTDKSTSDKST